MKANEKSKRVNTRYFYEYLRVKTNLTKEQIKLIEDKVITNKIRANLILFFGEDLEQEKNESNHYFSYTYLAVMLNNIAKKINAYVLENNVLLSEEKEVMPDANKEAISAPKDASEEIIIPKIKDSKKKHISTSNFYDYIEAKTGEPKEKVQPILNYIMGQKTRAKLNEEYGITLEDKRSGNLTNNYLGTTLNKIADKVNAFFEKNVDIPQNQIEATKSSTNEENDSKDLIGLLQREYLLLAQEEGKHGSNALNINNPEIRTLVNKFVMLFPNYLNINETKLIMILKLGVLKKIHYSSAVVAEFIGKDEKYVNEVFRKGLAEFIERYKGILLQKAEINPDDVLELFRNELFNQIDNDLDIEDNIIMSLLRGKGHKEGHIYTVQDLTNILGIEKAHILEIIANYIDYSLDILQEEAYGTLKNLENNALGTVYLGGKR